MTTESENKKMTAAAEESAVTKALDAFKQERAKDRKQVYIKYGLISSALALYVGSMSLGLMGVMGKQDPVLPGGYVSLVEIKGEIGPGNSASAEKLGPLLARAFADKESKGVILRINSPGGTPVQSSLIHDNIKYLKEKHNKKVVVVAEDVLASGAYFISAAADEIVVNRSTIAGSIGVISAGFGFEGTLEKLGIERRVTTAGESKNIADPFSPQKPADKEMQIQLLADIHKHFTDVVQAGRGSRLVLDTPGLFSGKVWTGEAAVAIGIADKLGDSRTAAKDYFNVDHIKTYAPEKPLLKSLLGSITASIAEELNPSLKAGPSLTYTPN